MFDVLGANKCVHAKSCSQHIAPVVKQLLMKPHAFGSHLAKMSDTEEEEELC